MLRREPGPILLGLCLLGLMLPLAGYAAVGWFSRYASDDYCTAGLVVERGFLGAQAYWYTAWSGRFSFFALVSALELGGVGMAQVLPALTLIGAAAAIAWALVPPLECDGWPDAWLAALVLAALIVFGVCASAPNLGQVLFWQTGALTYVLPLALLVVFVGWLVRVVLGQARTTRGALLGSGVLLAVSGGLSETTLALQVLVLGALLAGLLARRDRRSSQAARLVVAGLVGTLVAAAILGLAPGNAERVVRSEYPGPKLANLLLAANASVRLLLGFARRFEAEVRPVLVVCLLLPAALGAWSGSHGRALEGRPGAWVELRALAGGLVLLVLVACGLILSSFFPSYWVLGFDPPARVEVVAQAILVGLAVGVGYTAGRWIGRVLGHRPGRRALGVGLAAGTLGLLLVPLSVAAAEVRQLPSAAAYAAAWDDNDRLLRQAQQAGTREVTVPGLPQWWGWDWVGPRQGDFPNTCVARYYGLATVQSTPAQAPGR